MSEEEANTDSAVGKPKEDDTDMADADADAEVR